MQRCLRHRCFGLICKILAVIFALYLTGMFFSLQAQLAKAEKEYNELKKAHAIAQQDTTELRDLVMNGITERYILKIARKGGYILPGEQIYIDVFGD